MIKETIKFENFNGEMIERDYFFHLSRAEVLEMEASKEGGMSTYIQSIINTRDSKAIMGLFTEIVKKSYGEKSNDGMRFVKYPELLEAFVQSEAYSELIMKLCGDADAAAKFVNGVMPKNVK